MAPPDAARASRLKEQLRLDLNRASNRTIAMPYKLNGFHDVTAG